MHCACFSGYRWCVGIDVMFQSALRGVLIGMGMVIPLLAVFNVHASVKYSNEINISSWRAETSVFSCQLIHSVPLFGDAVFRTRAGERSGFYLRAQTSRFKAGEASVTAESPVWSHEQVREALATVKMKQGTRPLWLGNTHAEQMLSRLGQGLQLSFSSASWYDPKSGKPLELAISNIGFQKEYERYLACLSSLIPRNFDQLRRTALRFPSGEPSDEDESLPRSLSAQLDNILQLVKHDRKIRYFYIDGHTDSVGDRDENLALSKRRADLVFEYLKRRGVPEDWMTVRWHGERYPAMSNASSRGRAKNRRVTVRLERVEEIDVLPLAAK